MYYIAMSSIGRIRIGEQVMLTLDKDFDEISACRPNGDVVGYVVSFQIEGCLTKEFLTNIVNDYRGMVCDVAIKSGDVVILSSNGNCLPCYSYSEQVVYSQQ